MDENNGFLYKEETYELIGIAMEIHNQLGKGFSEIVYKDAFELELQMRGISYEREKEYRVKYKGVFLPHKFYADFVVGNQIILEVKSKSNVIQQCFAQVINYLAISGLKLGLIVNFHEDSLQHKRVIFS